MFSRISTKIVLNTLGDLFMKRFIGPVLALMLVLAACGSGTDTTDGVASLEDTTATTTVTTVAEVSQEEAVIVLVECLRDQGIDISDAEVGADGNVDLRSLFRQAEEGQFDREEMQAALDLCEDELAAVTVGFTRDFDLTEIQDQLVVWAQCMRDNGYQMDDPDLSSFGQPGGGNGGGSGGPFGDIDPEDPDFISANEACEDVRPGFGPGGGTGGPRP